MEVVNYNSISKIKPVNWVQTLVIGDTVENVGGRCHGNKMIGKRPYGSLCQ